MKLKSLTKLVLIILAIYSSNCKAILFLEGYSHVGFSTGDLDQTMDNGDQMDHNQRIYHFGIGGRAGIDLFGLVAGGVVEYNAEHWDGRRADQSGRFIIDTKGYNNDLEGNLYGLMGGLRMNNVRAWVEYYPRSYKRFKYAEVQPENPYNYGNRITGNGKAAGIGYIEPESKIAGSLMYRIENFQTLKRNGSRTSVADYGLHNIENHSFLFMMTVYFSI